MVVTKYGRNNNRNDEITKTRRRPIIAPAIALRLLIRILTIKTDRTQKFYNNYRKKISAKVIERIAFEPKQLKRLK